MNLKDLLKTLPALKQSLGNAQPKQLTEKDRSALLEKSKESFGLVVDHPQFIANPLATIREHLTNVISKQQAGIIFSFFSVFSNFSHILFLEQEEKNGRRMRWEKRKEEEKKEVPKGKQHYAPGNFKNKKQNDGVRKRKLSRKRDFDKEK